jgi:hypothetical protein
MAELWLTRTPNGRLLLHQRQPRRISRNKLWVRTGLSELKTPLYQYVRKVSENPVFIQGQVFRINEFPGSEYVLASKDNNAMVKAELYIPSPDEQLYNEFWVTSADNYTEHSRLTLHHKLKPTRMRESDEWKHNSDFNHRRYIKKNGSKWTSWRGHGHISYFPGAEFIRFEDTEPTRVEVRIAKF